MVKLVTSVVLNSWGTCHIFPSVQKRIPMTTSVNQASFSSLLSNGYVEIHLDDICIHILFVVFENCGGRMLLCHIFPKALALSL
jgi:hypothetical protein